MRTRHNNSNRPPSAALNKASLPTEDARSANLLAEALARFTARRSTSLAASQQAIQVRALCW